MSTMNNRRVITKVREIFVEGMWISCSLETTKELSNTFIAHMNSDTDSQDINMNGTTLFSIKHLNNENIYGGNIFHIYSGGIAKIKKLCSEMKTDSEMYDILKRYFVKYFKDRPQAEWVAFSNLIKILAMNYFNYKDNQDIYNENENRCLSFIYPMTHKDGTEMAGYLKNLAYIRDDKIFKDRFYVTR